MVLYNIKYDTMWYGIIMIQYGSLWYGIIIIQYGTLWYGMALQGSVWYVMVFSQTRNNSGGRL